MEKLKSAQRVLDFGRVRNNVSDNFGNNVTAAGRRLRKSANNNDQEVDGTCEESNNLRRSPMSGITTRSSHRLSGRSSSNNNNNNNNNRVKSKTVGSVFTTNSGESNINCDLESVKQTREGTNINCGDSGNERILELKKEPEDCDDDDGVCRTKVSASPHANHGSSHSDEGCISSPQDVNMDSDNDNDDEDADIDIGDDATLPPPPPSAQTAHQHLGNLDKNSRCSSVNSNSSPPHSPGRQNRGANPPITHNSEDNNNVDMTREQPPMNSHIAHPTSPCVNIHTGKNSGSSALSSSSSSSSSPSPCSPGGSSASSSSPTRVVDSANSLAVVSNNNSNKSSHECRQMRCNRSDGNTDTLGTSNNNKNKSSNNNNNNNNNVEKVNMAPMVFMNNLPYMGELTFDTRPRRGRKPKKADICHLISKNYGIQFPNSSINVPTSSTPASSSPRVSTFTNASGASTGVSTKSAKNKPLSTLPNPRRNNNHANSQQHHHHHHQQQQQQQHHHHLHQNHQTNPHNAVKDNKQFNHNVMNPTFIPNINWSHHVPPDLLPLASVNPAAAVALLNHPKGTAAAAAAAFKKISMYPSPSSRNLHEQLQQQQEQLQSLSRLASGQDIRHGESRADEPLNLCVRDKGSPHPNINPLDFLTISSAATGRGSHHNPYESGKGSSSALFSNFNLKHGSGNNSGGGSSKATNAQRKNNAQQLKRASGGNARRGAVVPDLVSDDQKLVNLNIQLNLSASKLANYVNSANNNRPLSFASPNSNFSVDPARLSIPQSSLQLSPPNNRGGKSKRKRAAAFSPENPSITTGALTVTPLGGRGSHNNDGHHHHSMQHFSHPSNTLGGHAPVDISNASSFPSGSSNAEVSICKFKFTGGAKPSLQEKKMLSLDSTGNFRFYSDKTSSSASPGSKGNNSAGGGCSGNLHVKDDLCSGGELLTCHNLPKSAKSMSMCMPQPMPALSVVPPSSSSETHSPSLPPMISPADLECSSSSDGPPPSTSSSMMASSTKDFFHHHHHQDEDGSGNSGSNNKMKMKRKRRTRKSLMREKLEKTFKEKGFLIQTQQLESAEGATYCKFRQLRKFTRYLFRSWKDYLPDNLKGANSAGHDESTHSAAAAVAAAETCVGTQPMLSSDLLLESMEQEDSCHHEDTEEGRSETPDNLTLSPAGGPSHVDENEDEDDVDELDDKDEDIGA